MAASLGLQRARLCQTCRAGAGMRREAVLPMMLQMVLQMLANQSACPDPVASAAAFQPLTSLFQPLWLYLEEA